MASADGLDGVPVSAGGRDSKEKSPGKSTSRTITDTIVGMLSSASYWLRHSIVLLLHTFSGSFLCSLISFFFSSSFFLWLFAFSFLLDVILSLVSLFLFLTLARWSIQEQRKYSIYALLTSC